MTLSLFMEESWGSCIGRYLMSEKLGGVVVNVRIGEEMGWYARWMTSIQCYEDRERLQFFSLTGLF